MRLSVLRRRRRRRRQCCCSYQIQSETRKTKSNLLNTRYTLYPHSLKFISIHDYKIRFQPVEEKRQKSTPVWASRNIEIKIMTNLSHMHTQYRYPNRFLSAGAWEITQNNDRSILFKWSDCVVFIWDRLNRPEVMLFISVSAFNFIFFFLLSVSPFFYFFLVFLCPPPFSLSLLTMHR